jgi:hypothetical protein
MWTKISLINAWLLGNYSSSFLTEFLGRNFITDTGIENDHGQMVLSPFHLINIFESSDIRLYKTVTLMCCSFI